MSIKHTGYSLYEFAVVLTIVAIILTFSLPIMFQQWMRKNSNNTYIQLKAIIKNAQEEALRRGTNIIVCAGEFDSSINSRLQTYFNDCGSNWSEGVLSYSDIDGDSQYDNGERIKAFRFDDGVNIALLDQGNGVLFKFSFNENGQIPPANLQMIFTFNLTQTFLGQNYSRKICLNSYGYMCIKDENDNSACAINGDSQCR
jgi:Tfp pilus assembly protein FimT